MDENGSTKGQAPRAWLKRTRRGLGILVLLLVIFHRPLLLSFGRRVANHYAARENLRIDCRLEGTVFTGLVVRNLRVVPTGPTIVESLDADYLRADYSLLGLWRGGASEFLKNVEVRNVTVVLDPAKASLKPKVPDPNKRITLPSVFPAKVRIADLNLHVRSTTAAQDFILEHFDLELNPEGPGALRMAKLQIPSLPAWSNLSAHTSYSNRKLIVTGLVLDSGNQLRLLEVDASQIKAKTLVVALDSSLAGGTFVGSVSLREIGTSLGMTTRLVADNISLDTLRGYIGRPPEFLSGNVDHLEIALTGEIDAPRTWGGTIAAQISQLKRSNITLDSAVVRLTARGGVATIETAELSQGVNKVRVTGSATLPNDIRELGRAPASLQVSGALPDLQALTAALPNPVAGSATLEGRVDIENAIVRAAINVSTGAITWNGGSADSATALITASKQMPPTGSEKVYYADLQSETNLDLKNVQQGDYRIDAVHATIHSADDLVTLENVLVTRAQNSVALKGTYRLPVDFARAGLQPADMVVSVNAIELGDYWTGNSPNKITGPVQVYGQVEVKDGLANGALSLYSANLRSRTFVIPEVSSQVTIARNVVYVNDFTASLNEHDFIRAAGSFALDKPHRYSGNAALSIADLSKFKSLLAAAGNKNDLAGALALDWHGSGYAGSLNNSGEGKLTLENGRYANLKALQARFEATYAPDGLTVPIVYFGSDKMLFQAVAEANGNTLEITNIQIDQGKAKYATGYVSFPLVWKNFGSDRPMVDPNADVAISFQSENLDLKKLFEDIGMAPLGSGLVSLQVDAKGPLAQLNAELKLQMRDLKSQKLPNFDPASFDLIAHVENNQLAVTGQLKQSRLQPISLDAHLPLNVVQIIEQRKFDENTPVTAKVQMPRSSVNFVRQFVPALEQLDGELTLDVNVNGTVAQPVLSGAGDMTINLARFSNPTLPALRGFKAHLAFNRDTLTFERFGGELAGGPFTLSGRLTFPKLTEPTFDLQIKATSVLVARNDDLTARADADLKVVGPFASATVTGNVALTNSQFLKNIDLIPIGLPGRPAPRPKLPSSQADFSFPQPPLRDWKFDVAVKTKDPFLIRGNLAHGGAIVDLHLGGTGLRPGLEGSVRLENVEATLPFSRLEIAQGFLHFDPSDSLNPKMDLQGISLIRDYTIHVYVYGTALAPEAVFTSEPPLPQEEIISLLATGTTREELLGGNNVLAGRAAMLLVQQMYRKVFKKGDASSKSNSVFDRLQLDIGNVDPRTGQQTATARYKLNEQFVLIGDLEVGGDFRGIVKYLLRFR